MTARVDLAIVGGGLAGGLIAFACHRARPAARLLLVEAGETLGGNHVWSSFESDVAPADAPLVAPFVAHRWPAYDVAFAGLRRTIDASYRSITSERFDATLRALLPAGAVRTGASAIDLTPTSLRLADGSGIEAGGVIDARGGGDLSALDVGWQKFVGRELVLDAPHGRDRPVVMDATVPQIDGYRFVYALPFAADRMFVEDTYYSDTPEIDHAALTARIAAYAAAQGWAVTGVAREEAGALPVVLGGDFERHWRAGDAGVAKAGVRAGLFHPVTGYSLPDAVRTARLVAGLADWSGAALHEALHAHAARTWAARGYYRMLDRMLFRAADPAERHRVFERFYRLGPSLVGRFYAARSTAADKARIVMGRPPVPIGRAIAAIVGRGPNERRNG